MINELNTHLKIVRWDEYNQNTEGLKGQWAQYSDGKGVFTIIKNILFITLLPNTKYEDLVLPQCHDGFLICSDGSNIPIKDSKLTCSLDNTMTAQGQLVLKKWC
jgi:hypothetical protein